MRRDSVAERGRPEGAGGDDTNATTDCILAAPATAEPVRLVLTDGEVAAAEETVRAAQLAVEHSTDGRPDSPTFLPTASVFAQELPRRLRETLVEMRALESVPACIVSGFRVDDTAIGPTPRRWAEQDSRSSTLREELWLVLCGSLLGDLFGWATQQNGALMHDISPTPGHEDTQLGSGSTTRLWWHTEEAFHPLKCDYLGLLSLRNADQVPTTFASLAGVELDPGVRDVLWQRRFYIRPDDSHLADPPPAAVPPGREGRLLKAARERTERMNTAPQQVAVLSGDPSAPYLSIDPYYMSVPPGDDAARDALNTVSRILDGRQRQIVLDPGDVLFLDNYRAVHGRPAFRARFDGTDRWLKRINITRDLRRSRAHRLTGGSRVVY